MPLPLSHDRVLEALRRLQPPALYSRDPSSDVQRELHVVAVPLASIADHIETLLGGYLPSEASGEILGRWEEALRLPRRPLDDLAMRRGRVVSTLRRPGGYTLARLAQLLAPTLGITPVEVQFREGVWAEIQATLTLTDLPPTLPIPQGGSGISRLLGAPWPGRIDWTGVRVELTLGNVLSKDVTASLRHPDGTVWTFAPNVDTGAQFGSLAVLISAPHPFQGKPSAGAWTLNVIAATAGATLNRWTLRVSDDVVALEIFKWFVTRPPELSGTSPDVPSAQRLIDLSGPAHRRAFAGERTPARCDDPYSLCDRDPIGA